MGVASGIADHPFAGAWDCLKRPVWLYDPRTGRKPYANPAALALWGADSLEALAARDFSARSPAIKARIRRLVERTAGGKAVSERWTFFPHGEPVTTQATVSAMTDPDGQVLLLFEAAPEDIPAEEKRAAEALRHASTLIGLYDLNGSPLFANPAVYRAYGQDDLDFVSRFASRSAGLALLAASGTAAVAGLHSVVTPRGTRWHHLDARPVLDPDTGLPCILLNEQDVTAQVEAEIARSEAEQVAAVARVRQQFLTEMSHELRTPLNAVIGFSRLLADANLAEDAADQAQRIHAAGLGLLDVVNRMIAEPADEAVAAAAEEAATPPVWEAAPKPSASPSIAEQGRRALYVDDNENNRTLVRSMLSTLGFICETANDGLAGVEAASKGDWDIILMDIQMPGLDGVEATRRIRSLPGRVAATPIIALTANTLAAQIQTYVEAGMDDCIAKPVNMVELLTKTSHWARSGWRDEVMDEEVGAGVMSDPLRLAF